MQYYGVVVGLNAVLLLFLFKIILAVLAVFELFVLFFSYSFYKESLSLCQDNTTNVVYSTVNTGDTSGSNPAKEHL